MADVYSSSLLYAGQRELSLVTSTFAGYFTSGGSSYNLTLPWQADKLEIYNYTKYGTNSQNLSSVWFRDMPAGDALIIGRGTTDLTSTLETTNGVTVNNTASAFTAEQVTITGISTASPGVVTAASHGLVAGDRVFITKLTGDIGDELNNKMYVPKNITSTTFELYDVHGDAINVVSTYSGSGGQINKVVAQANGSTQMSQPVYQLTLGSAVVGNDGDVMYFVAYKFNSYFNLGDIGA